MVDELHHVYELFDPSKFVAAWELGGREVTVTIARVSGEIIEGENARKAKKPVIYLQDWPKPLVLNKTNAKVLIALYGADYRKWSGKRFTMYPTTAKMAGEEVDAIRLKKRIPAEGSAPRPASSDRQPRTSGESVREARESQPAVPDQQTGSGQPSEELIARAGKAIAAINGKNTVVGVEQAFKLSADLRAECESANAGNLIDQISNARDERIRELKDSQ